MSVSMSYLASHSRNFEALLQTYRQINLTTQSVFLVLGTFLLSRVLEASTLDRALFLEFLLVSLTLFSNIVMRRFQKVITARGEDVNWWHSEIVRAEQSLPPEERAFTRFKINQSSGMRQETAAAFLGTEGMVSAKEIKALLDADIDHIRKVINTYILRGIRLMWCFIIVISVGSILMSSIR